MAARYVSVADLVLPERLDRTTVGDLREQRYLSLIHI